MSTLFLGWILLLTPGVHEFQVPMASKTACQVALNSATAIPQQAGQQSPAAYACINTETGEMIRR